MLHYVILQYNAEEADVEWFYEDLEWTSKKDVLFIISSLGRGEPLEKEMATHSSTLAWRIPWREEPGRLQSMGSQGVRHDWATSLTFLTGDWDAKAGSQETPGGTGKFGLGIWYEAGQTLTGFCQENALVIENTLFHNTGEVSTHGHHQMVNT